MKLKFVTSLFCALAISVHAAPPNEQVTDSLAMVQYMAKQEALSLAPIKNKDDVQRVLSKNSAIDFLSPTAKEIFLDSLIFGSRGLASFNFVVVQDELDKDQAHQLLGLFGMQHLIRTIYKDKTINDYFSESNAPSKIELMYRLPHQSKDYEGYECVSRGTCGRASTRICTSNC